MCFWGESLDPTVLPRPGPRPPTLSRAEFPTDLTSVPFSSNLCRGDWLVNLVASPPSRRRPRGEQSRGTQTPGH